MTTSLIQPSFSRGELGPELAARADIAAYQTGLAKCINFIVSPYGGVMNRPGTEFISSTKGNKVARLIRFKFNNMDTYALEFTDQLMRVIRNGSYVRVGVYLDKNFVVNGTFAANLDGWLTTGGTPTWQAPGSMLLKMPVGPTPADKVQQTMTGLLVGKSYTVTLDATPATAGSLAGRVRVSAVPNGSEVKNDVFYAGAFTTTFVATQETMYLSIVNAGSSVDALIDNVEWVGPYAVSPAAPIYELVTPFIESDLFELNYTQSADVMDIVHPNYKPQKLKRFAHDNWTIAPVSLVPSIAAPATATATPSGAGSSLVTQGWQYQITAVFDDGSQTVEESLPVTSNAITVKSDALKATLAWDAVATATYYNVYKDNAGAGIYGFIGRANSITFTDNNITPVKTDTPPTGDDPFIGAGNYPRAVGYFQQRLCYASTDNKPQTLYFSRTGVFTNFGYSFPLKDDDAITWTIASTEVNKISHLTPLRSLMTFTDGAEWIIQGQSSGFTPKTINGDPQTYNGIGKLRPLVLNNTALYAQERGRTVTAFGYSLQADGFSGSDISVLSPQMLQEYGLADWDYQQVPYSIVWGAREDGAMVGVTYMADQEVIGWHRHFTDGKVISVCSVPEGRQDALYLCVERQVDGSTVRYVERMAERQLQRFNGKPLINYAWFVDSGLRYDGTNSTAETITITGGTDWKYPEPLTATSSNGARFSAGDVGDALQYIAEPGTEPLRMQITAYISGAAVTVRPIGTVPSAIRGVPFTSWAFARDTLSGLDHLEGRDVVVLSDGNVINGLTVSGGSITIDTPGAVVLVGLPYESELQTLEVNVPNQETISDKAKTIKGVTAVLLETRGGWYGRSSSDADLWEFKPRQDTDDYGAIQPITGKATQIITDSWSGNGQLTVVQRDPLPMNILALIPRVDIGGAY